jgi:hypothetical protein
MDKYVPPFKKKIYNSQIKMDITNETLFPSLHVKDVSERKNVGNWSEIIKEDETIEYNNVDEEEESTSKLPSSLSAKITNQDGNLYIKFSRTLNIKTLHQFIEIFTRFLTIYKDYEEAVTSYFDEYIEDEEILYTEKNVKVKEKKIKQLRDNLFKITNDDTLKDSLFNPGTTGYTRTCECKKQPIILNDEKDILDWKNKPCATSNSIDFTSKSQSNSLFFNLYLMYWATARNSLLDCWIRLELSVICLMSSRPSNRG